MEGGRELSSTSFTLLIALHTCHNRVLTKYNNGLPDAVKISFLLQHQGALLYSTGLCFLCLITPKWPCFNSGA